MSRLSFYVREWENKMESIQIKIVNKDGAIKADSKEDMQSVLVYHGIYEKGDKIVMSFPAINTFYVIRLDDTLDEAYVYITEEELVYEIPFDEKKTSYNPKSFLGDIHYVTCRNAREHEINSYKNLALNVADQSCDVGCYPHVFANVETRGEAVFAARNAIDGVVANTYHGTWPFESWGINQQEDASLTLEFGREVDFDKIILTTRADFPHDNWWKQATLEFSDGTSEIIQMDKSIEAHEFRIKKKKIHWILLSHLIKSDDPSPFPALTQIEVYGTESKR